MTTKANAQHLATIARNMIESLSVKSGVPMAMFLKDWNVCVEQTGFTALYSFPTVGYTRKSQIIADLQNAVSQLEAFDEAEFNAKREAYRIANVDTAHDEALLASYGVEALRRVTMYPDTVISHDEAHAEALGMNSYHMFAQVAGIAWTPVLGQGLRNIHRQYAGMRPIEEIASDTIIPVYLDSAGARMSLFEIVNHRAGRAILDAAHESALEFNRILNNFPTHWPEYQTLKHWCKNETRNVICHDSRARAVLHMTDLHDEALQIDKAKEYAKQNLCRGYVHSYISGGRGYEKLYAVLDDGRVFRSEEIAQPNSCFDIPGMLWVELKDWSTDTMLALGAQFCGNYPIPAQCKA